MQAIKALRSVRVRGTIGGRQVTHFHGDAAERVGREGARVMPRSDPVARPHAVFSALSIGPA